LQPASVLLVRTAGLSVLRQLKLEEALLRADGGNWCIVNDGAASATAVLGLSGCVTRARRRGCGLMTSVTHRKPDVMLHAPRVLAAGVPVVRRFSGGGTVVVDRDTQLVSFIFGAEAAPDVQLFPAPLMKWSGLFYAGVFAEHADFRLRENGACGTAAAAGSADAHAQTTCSATASLAATRSPSSRAAGCTTRPSCGTFSQQTWSCCATRRACPRTGRHEHAAPACGWGSLTRPNLRSGTMQSLCAGCASDGRSAKRWGFAWLSLPSRDCASSCAAAAAVRRLRYGRAQLRSHWRLEVWLAALTGCALTGSGFDRPAGSTLSPPCGHQPRRRLFV